MFALDANAVRQYLEPLLHKPVVRLDHYKKKGPVGHEFIIFTTSMNSDSKEVQIRLQRLPARRWPIVGLPRGHLSRDVAGEVTGPFSSERYYHISTAEFSESDHALRVQDVIDVCLQIGQLAPQYDLLSTNCYWFCYKFLKMLEDKKSITLSKSQDHSRSGKLAGCINIPRGKKGEHCSA